MNSNFEDQLNGREKIKPPVEVGVEKLSLTPEDLENKIQKLGGDLVGKSEIPKDISEELEAAEQIGTAQAGESAKVMEEVSLVSSEKEEIIKKAQADMEALSQIPGEDNLGIEKVEEFSAEKHLKIDDEGVRTSEGEPSVEVGKIENISEAEGAKNVEMIVSELEALPEEEQEKIKKGLENIGFVMEKAKCDFLNKKIEQGANFVGKDKTVGRFLTALAEKYAEDSQKAQKNIELMDKSGGRGKILTLMNVGAIAKNIMWPARMAMGALPMRGLMAAGAIFSKGCEVAKEARLKNEEVIKKQKMQESEEAAEVAWRMYEMAQEKADGGKVSSEDLNEAFRKNIPRDVLRRVEKNKILQEESGKENESENRTGFASRVAELFAEKYIKFSATRMDKKMQKIEANKKLSKEEKKQEMMALLSKYSKQLKFVDESVADTGKIDLLAVGARAGELGGKAMMAVSATELLKTIWDKLPDFVENASGSEIKSGSIEFGGSHSVVNSGKVYEVDANKPPVIDLKGARQIPLDNISHEDVLGGKPIVGKDVAERLKNSNIREVPKVSIPQEILSPSSMEKLSLQFPGWDTMDAGIASSALQDNVVYQRISSTMGRPPKIGESFGNYVKEGVKLLAKNKIKITNYDFAKLVSSATARYMSKK